MITILFLEFIGDYTPVKFNMAIGGCPLFEIELFEGPFSTRFFHLRRFTYYISHRNRLDVASNQGEENNVKIVLPFTGRDVSGCSF